MSHTLRPTQAWLDTLLLIWTQDLSYRSYLAQWHHWSIKTPLLGSLHTRPTLKSPLWTLPYPTHTYCTASCHFHGSQPHRLPIKCPLGYITTLIGPICARYVGFGGFWVVLVGFGDSQPWPKCRWPVGVGVLVTSLFDFEMVAAFTFPGGNLAQGVCQCKLNLIVYS